MLQHIGVVVGTTGLLAALGINADKTDSTLLTSSGMLSGVNSSVSVASQRRMTRCSALVYGTWDGVVAFYFTPASGIQHPAQATSNAGLRIGNRTTKDGDFEWSAPDGTSCQIRMLSYKRGRAIATLRGYEHLAQATPADPPSYVTWYTLPPSSPWPTPITGAYVGIGGALGAANIYNTATNGFGVPGTAMLGLSPGECYFLCYGSPGVASANVLAIGTDVSSPNPESFMTIGAPDDCKKTGSPLCPAGIADQVFSVEGYLSPTASPTVFLAMDASANFAVPGGIYAGGAVIAGAPNGTPGPLPSVVPGSLVSYTGNGLDTGAGELLLGSSANSAKCDYDETNEDTLTCNRALVISSGGIQPNGASGGYAPEALPQGSPTAHPQILSGSCAVTAPSSGCTFPNSFAFSDTGYNCSISAQGTSPGGSSYVKSSASKITVYSTQNATFSYTCME